MGKKQWVGRVYIGGGQYKWCGRFDTKRERDRAVAQARVALDNDQRRAELTCEEYGTRFLERYERNHKFSSYTAARYGLKRFFDDFGPRQLASIGRHEAREWAHGVPMTGVKVVVTMFNEAVDDELIERNPFRGLVKRSKGRSQQAPPTATELDVILAACSVHKEYAQMMRALVRFAAYSGMRPGELFALEWGDIDFDRNRVHVQRRVYEGKIDTPKSNKSKLIALTPPARDAILGLPKDGPLVFRTKAGKRFSQPVLSRYWALVLVKADLEFDFYMLKHYCVHYMFATLGLSPRALAAQMGWSTAVVYKMLETYGHGDIGALEEIDQAFGSRVVPLRAVEEA